MHCLKYVTEDDLDFDVRGASPCLSIYHKRATSTDHWQFRIKDFISSSNLILTLTPRKIPVNYFIFGLNEGVGYLQN